MSTGILTEALDNVLASSEEKAKTEYDAALEALRLTARVTDLVQAKMALAQCVLTEAASEAQKEDQAHRSALEETRARANEAL